LMLAEKTRAAKEGPLRRFDATLVLRRTACFAVVRLLPTSATATALWWP
jgi:hypothetical protein